MAKPLSTRTSTPPEARPGPRTQSGKLERARKSELPPRASPSGTHARARKRGARPAVRVDDVGQAAVELAGARRERVPRLLASRGTIAKAPLDARAAFVLSLIDGRNGTTDIVDMAGMPEEEVHGILRRLARLGLISVT